MTAPRHRTRFIRYIFLAVLVGAAAAGIALVWHWANEPVVATITAPGNTMAAAAPVSFQTISTVYYSFRVPSGMRVRTTAESDHPGIIHSQIFDTATSGSQAGITSNALPAAGLPGIADYNLRTTLTSRYTPYTAADLPAGSRAFRNLEDGELTLFMTHGSRYVSVSVTGIGNYNRLGDFLRQIYSTWQWQ